MYLPRSADPVCAAAWEASVKAAAPAQASKSHGRIAWRRAGQRSLALFFLKTEFAAAFLGTAVAAAASFCHDLPFRLDLHNVALLGGVTHGIGRVDQGLHGGIEIRPLR